MQEITGLDWHWIFVVPFLAALVVRYINREWRVFGALCVVIACLITLVDARLVEARVRDEEVLGVAIGASFLGFLVPNIARGVWGCVSHPRVRWYFLAGLLIVVSTYSPTLQQLLASFAIIAIMIYGLWIMIGRPRFR